MGHAPHKPPAIPPSASLYPGMHSHEAAAESELGVACSGQLSHTALPASGLYFPGSHAAQGPSLGPEYPLLHRQLLWAVLAGAESEFSGQREHPALPEASLYSPARHAVHSASSGPEYPGLHVHTLLPAGLEESTGHSKHSSGPTGFLNVPARHAWHGAPFAPVYPALHLHSVTSALPDGDCEWSGQSSHIVGSNSSL